MSEHNDHLGPCLACGEEIAQQRAAAAGERPAQRWASVPLCTDCWLTAPESGGATRVPARVTGGLSFMELLERCVQCDRVTCSGIYVRRQVQQ